MVCGSSPEFSLGAKRTGCATSAIVIGKQSEASGPVRSDVQYVLEPPGLQPLP